MACLSTQGAPGIALTASTLGLIVNPIAGIGGAVGLKGSDGQATVQRALELGGVPRANDRTKIVLAALRAAWPVGRALPVVLAPPGPMGEAVAREAGFTVRVVGAIDASGTSAEDTRRAARQIAAADAALLLFAGGDGTARDIAAEIGTRLPVLGLPAGVKMHSACFATSPRAAAALAASFLLGGDHRCADREVLDLDEDAYRQGEVIPRFFAVVSVPADDRLLQSRKAPSPPTEAAAAAAIAEDVVEGMVPGRLYVLGPGTSVAAIAMRLGVPKTLVGVDLVADGRLVQADAGIRDLEAAVIGVTSSIVIGPIGGQGFLFGRGNQPIGPRVIRSVGRGGLIVVASPNKLASLRGRPMLVDTGDSPLDQDLAGYVSVVSGYRDRTVYPVAVA